MQCPVSSCPDVQTSRAQMAQMASGLEAKKGSSPVFPANSAPNCLPAPHSSQHNTNLWVQRKFPSPRSGAAFHVFFFFLFFFSFFPVVERPCPTSSGQGQRAPIDFRARERLSYLLSFFFRLSERFSSSWFLEASIVHRQLQASCNQKFEQTSLSLIHGRPLATSGPSRSGQPSDWSPVSCRVRCFYLLEPLLASPSPPSAAGSSPLARCGLARKLCPHTLDGGMRGTRREIRPPPPSAADQENWRR